MSRSRCAGRAMKSFPVENPGDKRQVGFEPRALTSARYSAKRAPSRAKVSYLLSSIVNRQNASYRWTALRARTRSWFEYPPNPIAPRYSEFVSKCPGREMPIEQRLSFVVCSERNAEHFYSLRRRLNLLTVYKHFPLRGSSSGLPHQSANEAEVGVDIHYPGMQGHALCSCWGQQFESIFKRDKGGQTDKNGCPPEDRRASMPVLLNLALANAHGVSDSPCQRRAS